MTLAHIFSKLAAEPADDWRDMCSKTNRRAGANLEDNRWGNVRFNDFLQDGLGLVSLVSAGFGGSRNVKNSKSQVAHRTPQA